jgi:hypothetical protein
MRRVFLVLIAVVGPLASTQLAYGQIPYRSYTPPAGSPLPNQLEYFRPQSGVLDQYNQFVAPKENLSNQLRAIAGQQNRDYQALQTRVDQSSVVRAPQAAATGTAAGFMNYSHYFGSRGGGTSAMSSRSISPSQRYTTTLPGVGTAAGLPGGIGSAIGPASGIGGNRTW